MLLREFAGRKSQPTAMVLDSRTLQSTPASGARAGYNGKTPQRIEGPCCGGRSGPLLALHITLADALDRAQPGERVRQVQQIREENVELVYVDQGCTGEAAEEAAAQHGIQLQMVKHTEAKRGFVPLRRRWW
jgi:hypothetical protein